MLGKYFECLLLFFLLLCKWVPWLSAPSPLPSVGWQSHGWDVLPLCCSAWVIYILDGTKRRFLHQWYISFFTSGQNSTYFIVFRVFALSQGWTVLCLLDKSETLQCFLPSATTTQYVWLSLTLCLDVTGHFTFFSLISIVGRGWFPKVGLTDGFCLSHLKCPVLESCNTNLTQMTLEDKWMFSCLLGTKESILCSQWPFQL